MSSSTLASSADAARAAVPPGTKAEPSSGGMSLQEAPPAPGAAMRSPDMPADHPATAFGKVGVLLLNLGTPDGTSYWPMRRYLKEFLSDRRVIEVPKAIWWPILNLIILTTRPSKKGKDYASIWNTEKDEGPLKTITREQAEGLGRRLAGHSNIVVDFAMRYQNPSTESRIKALQAQGCDRILLVPLYPHYAAATTGTACDQAFRALMTMRWQPAVRVAPAYADDPVYIDRIARSIEEHLAKLPWQPDAIIATFHGMPEKYLFKGDPYHCQCLKTSRLVRERLGLANHRWITTFQSRFGNDPWLQPYTDETVESLAKSGVKKLALVAPGFSADCLETLEELDVENREIFLTNGGEEFTYIPALNASENGLDVIEAIVRREVMGWLPA
jgi:protoporphyrin/coproporphyrin ferrochelatase